MSDVSSTRLYLGNLPRNGTQAFTNSIHPQIPPLSLMDDFVFNISTVLCKNIYIILTFFGRSHPFTVDSLVASRGPAGKAERILSIWSCSTLLEGPWSETNIH